MTLSKLPLINYHITTLGSPILMSKMLGLIFYSILEKKQLLVTFITSKCVAVFNIPAHLFCEIS